MAGYLLHVRGRLLRILCGVALLGALGAAGAAAQPGMVQCPDGKWVPQGPCKACPDGSFISYDRVCVLAPDGRYVPGRAGHDQEFAPDGAWVPKGDHVLCPDGRWVAGQRCILAPDGTWVGR